MYRARGHIGQLGLSQASGNEGNKGGGELHLEIDGTEYMRYNINGLSETTV